MARNIDEELLDINSSIRQATQATLPTKPATQHKPWISKLTLQMIDERTYYRAIGDTSKEKLQDKQIKRQVQIDRQEWLDALLQDGNWNAVKYFKK